MFALFFSLYYAMFTGSWNNFNLFTISGLVDEPINAIGTFATSIFGDNQMTTLGDVLTSAVTGYTNWIVLLSFILALITSIGIVVMAVKGVKKAFGIFFMSINRL